MLEAFSNTSWTTTRVAPTKNAPFAGLGEPTPAAPSAFAGAQQGVALMLLGLGALALWSGLRAKARP
jgi:hypothetical protein